MSFAEVDAVLQSWVDERDLSGTVLMTRAGAVVFEGSYGLADRAAGSPVTSATRFGLASVTKLFTAVALVDLVSAGATSFDAPVVAVLPPERRPSTLLPEVTLHHLLTHTSGIADYCEEDEDTPGYLEDYGSLWERLPSYSIERPADLLPLFADLPPPTGHRGCGGTTATPATSCSAWSSRSSAGGRTPRWCRNACSTVLA